MGLIRLVTELIASPLDYPLWWLFLSWLIWLLLKWRNGPRPTISIMLVYSTSVVIFYIKSWQWLRACMGFELCVPSFSLIPFLAAVSFWFIILYIPVALTVKPQVISEQIRRNWWIVTLVIALAVWHFSTAVISIVRSLEYSNLTSSDPIVFYPVLIILLSWLFWLLPKFVSWPGPTLPAILICSIAVANVSFRLWTEGVYEAFVGNKVVFSFPLFLIEVAVWFIVLYAVMKLTLQIERRGAI